MLREGLRQVEVAVAGLLAGVVAGVWAPWLVQAAVVLVAVYALGASTVAWRGARPAGRPLSGDPLDPASWSTPGPEQRDLRSWVAAVAVSATLAAAATMIAASLTA